MDPATKSKLSELQSILTKMPLEVCCVTALPELGVRWRQLAQAVRNARLPMTSASVARVLKQHVAKSYTSDEVDDLVSCLRLKMIATQHRVWYLIKLTEPIEESNIMNAKLLPFKIKQAVRNSKSARNMRVEVKTANVDEMTYTSIQLVSATKDSPVLYIASSPRLPVACVSTLRSSGLLKSCVLGLGYQSYEDASLYGPDIKSLLRIYDSSWNADNVNRLIDMPEYAPMPVITKSGIDYTNKAYDEQYVENILGPDPPLLTELTINTTRPFFDPTRLNKNIKMKIILKSENVAKSLKTWVGMNALAPTSDFFKIFQEMKSNKLNYENDD